MQEQSHLTVLKLSSYVLARRVLSGVVQQPVMCEEVVASRPMFEDNIHPSLHESRTRMHGTRMHLNEI